MYLRATKSLYSIVLTFLAGTPTYTEFESTSLVTTEPAPIFDSLPITTSSTIHTLGPMYTLSPMVAALP